VVVNVLLNGIEAMRNGNGTEKTLSIRTQRTAPALAQITISDTGPGLAPDLLADIFEPFFTTKPNGLGMGLAISRSIIESHGGTLRAEAGNSGGATFIGLLPLAPAEQLGDRQH
jgi:C4-dicarboxylate-specific signal transduction histidine kinase